MSLKSAFTLFSLAVAGSISLAGDAVPVYQNKPEESVSSINDLANKVLPKSGGDELFYRDTKNQRIGIGTVSPECTLDVVGNICVNGSVIAGSGSSSGSYLIAIDSQSATTDGGDFASGAWRTRVLNTELANTISGVSLASNQVTLPSGTYYTHFSAPAFLVLNHQTRLQSVSGYAVKIIGQNAYSFSGDHAETSEGHGVFTIPDSTSTVLELQHRCNTTRNGNGFGVSANFGEASVYAVLEIWQLAE